MMTNKVVLLITSGIISVSAYLLLITLLVFTFFHTPPTHYSSLSESTLSLHAISIEAIIDDKPTPTPKEKQESTNAPLAGSGIKDMFERIESDEPSKAPIGDNREQLEQNAKNQKLKELQANAQELQNRLNTLSNLTISANSNQNDGEFDEWYAQIEKIMLQKWQKTFYVEEKLQALVRIHISSSGVFSYKIVKYSGNNTFDESLKSMLEECTAMSFAPHPKGAREIATTFKN